MFASTTKLFLTILVCVRPQVRHNVKRSSLSWLRVLWCSHKQLISAYFAHKILTHFKSMSRCKCIYREHWSFLGVFFNVLCAFTQHLYLMRNVCPNESEKEAYLKASMYVGFVYVYNIQSLIDKKMNDYQSMWKKINALFINLYYLLNLLIYIICCTKDFIFLFLLIKKKHLRTTVSQFSLVIFHICFSFDSTFFSHIFVIHLHLFLFCCINQRSGFNFQNWILTYVCKCSAILAETFTKIHLLLLQLFLFSSL